MHINALCFKWCQINLVIDLLMFNVIEAPWSFMDTFCAGKQEGARHVHHTEVNFYARETRYTAQQTHNLDKDTLSHRLQSALLYSFRDLTFLFCQALHMHGFARALPHGASNNRHQVQYGNWHFSIRRKKKSRKGFGWDPFLFWFQRGYPSVHD